MDKKAIDILIEKYLNGKCSAEEEQILMSWYDAQSEDEEYTKKLTENEKIALEESMFQTIMHPTASTQISRESLIKKMTGSAWFKVAACLALFLLSLPLYWDHLFSKRSYQTAFGEVRSVVLPDESKVVLNGNSSITYKKPADSTGSREVWLDGEASFHVTHMQNQQRFIVHLADTLSIEVVGTEFNVIKRPSGTQIALKNGKIRLRYHHPNVASPRRTIIEMAPNEVISFARSKAQFQKTITSHIVNYFAWQDKKILLQQTTLADIRDLLHDTYGIDITFVNDSVLNRSASGSIPVNNGGGLQLLKNVTELYDLEIIEMKDNSFILKSRQR